MSLHVTAEVLTTKRVGAFQHVSLLAPGVAERFRPGTFVAVSLPGARLARRSLWIAKVQPIAGYGAAIGVVVDPVGVGGEEIAALRRGDRLPLTGPLGRPFALPREPVAALLVGEGYAAAMLTPLAERLHERGCAVSFLLGAAEESRLLPDGDARRLASTITVATADGSVGHAGDLASLVPEALRRTGAEVVYAAGPPALLHAVALAAEERGVWSQTALEVPHGQPCGIGSCHGCPLPVVGEDGIARSVRACAEGPVVRGDRVRWHDLLAGRP